MRRKKNWRERGIKRLWKQDSRHNRNEWTITCSRQVESKKGWHASCTSCSRVPPYQHIKKTRIPLELKLIITKTERSHLNEEGTTRTKKMRERERERERERFEQQGRRGKERENRYRDCDWYFATEAAVQPHATSSVHRPIHGVEIATVRCIWISWQPVQIPSREYRQPPNHTHKLSIDTTKIGNHQKRVCQ